MMPTAAAIVANETVSAARVCPQPRRISQATAGCRPIASTMPMSTQSRIVRISTTKRTSPKTTSAVSVATAA